jgi:pimeloyl-ACP methyl ester carboxylesterase
MDSSTQIKCPNCGTSIDVQDILAHQLEDISYKNTKITYSDTGQGNTLVLLHGFTESQSIWDGFVSALSDSYRVVTIDLPGHGQSGCLGAIHTMEEMAGCVKAVLDHLQIEKCVMVGHSMGGYVALAFSRLYPDHIKGLGLFHSTAAADSQAAIDGRNKAIAAIRQNHKHFLLQFIPSLFAPENLAKHQPLIDNLIHEARKMSSRAIIAAQEGMKLRADSRDILKNAPFPILFICGKKDSRIPVDSILPQIALPKTSYSLILEEAGHMGWAEADNVTIHMVKSFTEACYLSGAVNGER